MMMIENTQATANSSEPKPFHRPDRDGEGRDERGVGAGHAARGEEPREREPLLPERIEDHLEGLAGELHGHGAEQADAEGKFRHACGEVYAKRAALTNIARTHHFLW